ncbi:DNA-dependent protein kinase catalytic subunit-like isoform X2 [Branchiostoma floridae x Branchiostoma japonicum]
MHRMLYDELVTSVLKVIDKLDLTTSKQAETGTEELTLDDLSSQDRATSDPITGLQAAKPRDFVVFINVVDFCRDLLPHHHPKYFQRWVYTVGHALILHSTRLPLVSGFYKLLSVCMTICTKVKYFKDLDTKVISPSEESMDTEGRDRSSEGQACFTLFRKFVREVLVRLKQYKDDLLASCLMLVLSLPHQIVQSEISSLVPALQTTFRLGLSYLPLAHAGLDALERWLMNLPRSALEPHFPHILPYLDSYLRTGADAGSDSSGDGFQTVSLTAASSTRGKRKIPIKLLKAAAEGNQAQESDLVKARLRIVRFLGSLGGHTNACLVTGLTAEDLAKRAVAWDTQTHLQFAVPFMDMKPTVCLDPFLPRICELATTSSDRQTKVAACELLHSLVLYMVGQGAQQPGETQAKNPMTRLYKKVFPVLMQLACDVEQVARQLFEPLMLQLIHWLTNNRKYESDETIALLDAIMDGLVHPTDTALRDFSSRCVREFLQWSIKQTSPKQLEKSPINIKSLLKRLYSLALHPNPFNRLGAALGFNSIYRDFREEESQVDMFTFELLVTFVESLALAHHDERSLGTQAQCVAVLTHLERIVTTKADLLNKNSKVRRVPRGFDRERAPVLSDLVTWLLLECGRPQTECRHRCMLLVCSFLPLLPGKLSPGAWMKERLKEAGPDFFVTRFEGGGGKSGHKSGIRKYPTISTMDSTFAVRTAVSWFDLILAALDSYCWALGQRLLSPSDVLSGSGKKPSQLFTALEFFLSKLALSDIDAAARCFRSGGSAAALFTPRETEEYNYGKCTVIVRIMDFFTVLLGMFPQESCKIVPDTVWKSPLFDMIVTAALEPTALGFNMGDVEIMENLPQETRQLLVLMCRSLPSQQGALLKAQVAEKLARRSSHDLFSHLPELSAGAAELDHVRLTLLVSGYQQLHAAGLLLPALGAQSGQSLAGELVSAVFRSMVTRQDGHPTASSLPPSFHRLAGGVLELACQLHPRGHDLLDCVMNKTPLMTGGGKKSSTFQGMVFFSTFKSCICHQLIQNCADSVPVLLEQLTAEPVWVGSILHGLLDHLAKDKTLRKKEGAVLCDTLLQSWPKLAPWWEAGALQDSKSTALTLLRKILIIDSQVSRDPTHPAFRPVFSMYLDMLTDSRSTLPFKSQVLDLLPFFTVLPQTQLAELKARLDRMVADNFPLKSAEFPPGSSKYNDYIGAVTKLLSALELSSSLTLLELLISVMCRETRHVMEEDIQTSLSRFIKSMGADRQKPALDIPYGIFRREGSFPNEIRRSALERVCLPMLRLVHPAALTEFFTDHIREIMDIIGAPQTKAGEASLCTQLTNKLCCYQLLETMYSRLPKEDVNTPPSRIVRAYKGQEVKVGNELTTAITKFGHAAKSEDLRGETGLLDLRREYHCAAYNALIAIISCTQTDMKFYTAFLFQENTAKGQFLLDNLVDTNKIYQFDAEFSAPVSRKKQFVSIRQEVRGQDSPEAGTSRYMQSYLAGSSLSEDISQFDFTSGTQVKRSQTFTGTQERHSQASQGSSGLQGRQKQDSSVNIHGDFLEMEMDELNQHECMSTMSAVLQHMARNNITPQVQQGAAPKDMPPWMSCLNKKLGGSSSHKNVKLFIAKLVVNNEEVFRPYARFWLSPLMELVVRGEASGEGINYFIVDLLVTMLSWAAVAVPEDSAMGRALTSRLLQFLMANTFHKNRAVMRNNLELIKTAVECWKGRMEVPTKVIHDQLCGSDPASKGNAVGIQLLGVVLANQLPPFNPATSGNIDREQFFSAVAKNLQLTRYKDVYAAAAEVIGMIMKYMADVEKVTDGGFHTQVERYLLPLQVNQQDVFLTCVHKIHLHFPPFTDRFVSKLLFMLPKLHGIFRTNCLEVIRGRVNVIDNLFLELKTRNFLGMLTHRDDGLQAIALQIVYALLQKLQVEELLYLLPAVAAFASHPAPECRRTMYDIMMWIYDNYREEASQQASAGRVLGTAKDCLLQGLSDEESYLRLLVQNFWSHETRLPTGTLERLVAMLECMHSPRTEHQYLSYCTNLLLEMTSRSPDFSREVFQHPLSECRFQDVQIDHSWKQRHVAMTPMFVETQSSHPASSQSQGHSLSQGGQESLGGQLRATQDVLQFTATQATAVPKNAYNWLTQSSLDTFADYSIPLGTETQSSLLFTTDASKKAAKARRLKPVGPGFGSDRLSAGRDQTDGRAADDSQQSEILRLKRRFLKDQDVTRAYHARRQIRAQRMREERVKEQRAKRGNLVTLYRQYRVGDLPDIQIKYSYIIAPLQALAQRDSMLARLLFSSLFRGIFEEIENVKTEREAEELTEQISKFLNTALSNSEKYFPPFISSLQEICYREPRKLSPDASVIQQTGVVSLQQPIGIVLLEEQLVQKAGVEEPRSKRARTSSTPVSAETHTWIELARLYKSLGDFDVLRGIFSGKVGTQTITYEALEAEARGDFKKAVELYNQAMQQTEWPDPQPLSVEEDLWDDSRLQCYDHLTQWKNLYEVSTVNIDDDTPPDLDKMWDDTYFQEHYLPFALRSKLKLLLEGEMDQSLLTFVDSAMQKPDRKALLESHYCEELAMLYLYQDDYGRAKYHLGTCTDSFLQEWSGMDRLMASSRAAKLQGLQKLTEMQEFLELISNDRNFETPWQVNRLLEKWSSRYPDDRMDPISVWDDIIANRCLYLDKLNDKFEQMAARGVVDTEGGGEPFSQRAQREQFLLRLVLVDSAREQANFPVALKHLKNTVKEFTEDDRLRLRWTHCYTRLHQRKASLLTGSEKLNNVLTTFEQLDKFSNCRVFEEDLSVAKQHHTLTSLSYEIVAHALLQEGGTILTGLKESRRAQLLTAAGVAQDTSVEQTISSLLQKGHACLQKAVKLASDEEKARHDASLDKSGIVDAFMAMVSFCDKILRHQEDDDEGTEITSIPGLPVAVVTNLLQALRHDSPEARQRFPRLLQLVELYPDTMDIFIQKVSHVPSWLCISWLGQMVALLDKPEAVAVHGILTRIAQDYPQALVYPLKISSENFEFEDSVIGRRNQEAVNELKKTLSVIYPLVDKLIGGLEQLSHPDQLFKDWGDDADLKRLLKVDPKKRTKEDKVNIKRLYEEMYNSLLDFRSPTQDSSMSSLFGSQSSDLESQSVGFGPFRRRFAQQFAKECDKMFGKDGGRILDMKEKEFVKLKSGLQSMMGDFYRKAFPREKGNCYAPGLLKDYCPWLSDFNPLDYDRELEIPGQYTGKEKPLVQYHAKIAGFDQRVKVMGSLRKPKRITIRGDDERDRPFLVKGGEDLRQDQRIQQLFDIMNDILTLDPACSQRQLRIRTYGVIPMTSRVGLIEWMQNTTPLGGFLESAMTPREQDVFLHQRQPISDYAGYVHRLSGAAKNEPWGKVYGALYQKASRTDVTLAFRQVQSKVTWDIMRRGYLQLSSCPEAFLTLRAHFTTTHAALCIAQYILGIGDRHLGNFMIDLESGGMVGIDFGHAFGSATQHLPVPELMPFRLTRQMLNLLLPLKESGLLQSTMVHVLRALRSRPNILLNTMDVFIKEPHLDWKNFAAKQMDKGMVGEDDDLDDISWYPREKIKFAARKLQGVNPTHITKAELQLGHKSLPWFKSFCLVAAGDGGKDVRAQKPAEGLSVEDQVACLIDQATDPNILGRTWQGWQSFM